MKKVLPLFLLLAFFWFGVKFGFADEVRLKTSNPHSSYQIPWWGELEYNLEVSPETFLSWYSATYLKGSPITWEETKHDVDEIGMEHIRFQQYYNGVKVQHGVIILHLKDRQLISFNGEIYPIFSDEVTSVIGQSLDNYQSQRKVPHLNKQAEQVYRVDSIGTARLCDVYLAGSEKDLLMDKLFVVYGTDQIIRIEPQHIDADAKGTATTYYVGKQSIVTDSISKTSFRLRETARPIRTYKGKLGDDFYDADNNWNNSGEQIGADIHYAAQLLHTFLKKKFGWDSYANRKDSIVSVANLSGTGNAFWSLGGNYATFLAGSSSTMGPCASIDVVGHEFGHGIADENAGLIYSGESCMLHESFADISGTLLERYHDSSSFNWLLGEKVWTGVGIRNMRNPKAFNHPDTYQGKYFTSSGCHHNGGVQNYWFYLMTMGDTSTNDFAYKYSVKGMGFEKATAILYRAIFYYWTANTGYANATTYSLQAAKDLYGSCSNELQMTIDAWKAVGLEDKNFVSIDLTADIVAPKVICSTLPQSIRLISKGDVNRKVTWYFENGDSAKTNSLDFIAQRTGAHKFILKTEVCGYTLWDSATSVVTYQPQADFDLDKAIACFNGIDSIVATNSTVNKDLSQPLNYEWTVWPLGDVYSSKNLSLLPNLKLDLTYVLKAYYKGGCWDTTSKTVVLANVPKTSISIQPSCVGENLKISNNTDSSLSKLSFKWYFYDSLKSESFSPKIIGNQPGNSNLRIICVDLKTGCYNYDTLVSLVNPLPQPQFKALNPCVGQDITVVNRTTHSSPANYTRWWLPDSRPFNKDTVLVLATTNPQIIVGLEYKDQKGCLGIGYDTLNLEEVKTNFALSDSICSGQDLLLTSTSTPKQSNTKWYLNDQLVGSDSNFLMKQITAGNKEVKQVNKGLNCSDSLTKSITVIQLPSPGFTVKDAVCDGETVSVKNTSELQKGTAFSWLWGDGTTNSGDTLQHTFTLPNSAETESFVISLKAKDAFGCEGQTAKTVTVNALPTCDFEYVTNGLSVEFNPTVKDENYMYRWIFDDGDTAITMKPKHVFATRQFYDVTLQITTDIGCICSATKTDILNKVSVALTSTQMVRLSPNPTNGSFSISGFTSDELQQIVITDLSGRVVYTESFQPKTGEADFDVKLIPGFYNVNVQNREASFSKRLTVISR